MVYLDVLIQLYSCVQWHFYQTMIVARSSLSAKFPWSMVIYDTSEDIWKIFKIYGYFENFENFGKFWIFLKILEKNWKFWKKNENFGKKISKVGGKFWWREGYMRRYLSGKVLSVTPWPYKIKHDVLGRPFCQEQFNKSIQKVMSW